MSVMQRLLVVGVAAMAVGSVERVASHDYDEALEKSILFFEGMRSGKLPPTQRMNWRKDSGLRDGHQIGVDLVGGYYDAGDNLKFHFPMAWSITMLAWSVLEFGQNMGSDLQHALEAIQWGTDYFLKATSIPGFVFAQVGDPYDDHNCWQRPEDMDTPRTPYAVSKDFPGSEVSAEIAAALAASSLVFRPINRGYSERLLRRARMVFEFADKYRGSYNESLGQWVCPYYCDYSGYEDELLWGAAWLFRATRVPYYWNYVLANIRYLDKSSFTEFGWDNKHAGINVLVLKLLNSQTPYSISNRFLREADKFVCSMLPESPTVSVSYSPGGLLFKTGGSNMQHTTALSFLLVAHARFLSKSNRVIYCGGNVIATPNRLAQVARSQVDYILGSNPSNMSYMVGYGGQFPRRIHHRGSSLPSINQHPEHISCADGKTYFARRTHNPNELTGAVVGGPDLHDSYADSRVDYEHSEPATYINAPLVGLLAYFTSH